MLTLLHADDGPHGRMPLLTLFPGYFLLPLADMPATGPATEPRALWQRLLFVGLCLLLPVVWGAIVNRMFDLWQRRPTEAGDDRIFPEYQI